MTRVTFSVITAAYQAAGTIAEAVESALAQTYPALELVVADDGSTDDLSRALKPYRKHIVVLTNHHRGPSAARNAALRKASGDFVAILDADDSYEPERLAALADLAATRPDLDILATDAVLERRGEDVGRFYREDFPFPADDQRLEILRRCFLCAPAVRRRRLEAIQGFDEALGIAEDWDCWMRAILDGARAGLVDAPLLRYRLGHSSLTADRSSSLWARVTVMQKAAGRPDLSEHERDYLGRALAIRRWDAISASIDEGETPKDRRARGAAFAVATRNDVALRSRMKAASYALSPTLTSHALRRRRSRLTP